MANRTVHSSVRVTTRDYQSGILDASSDVNVSGVQRFSYL